MSWRSTIVLAIVGGGLVSSAGADEFGRTPASDEIKLWNIDVSPSGAGLPEGNGTVAQGKSVYENNCEACHGVKGVGGLKDRLVGGQGTLATDMPIKTVGSYWPYATTVFDYIHRAMPYTNPGDLNADDTYAVVALLFGLAAACPSGALAQSDQKLTIDIPVKLEKANVVFDIGKLA
jgi:cytochrome c